MGTRTLIRFVAPARACRLSDPPRKKLSAHGSTAEEFIFHVGRHSLCVNGHVQDAKRMWSLQVVLRHLDSWRGTEREYGHDDGRREVHASVCTKKVLVAMAKSRWCLPEQAIGLISLSTLAPSRSGNTTCVCPHSPLCVFIPTSPHPHIIQQHNCRNSAPRLSYTNHTCLFW